MCGGSSEEKRTSSWAREAFMEMMTFQMSRECIHEWKEQRDGKEGRTRQNGLSKGKGR